MYDVELSPDGRNLYTAAAISDSVVVFARDSGGRLQAQGCVAETTVEGCTDGRALDGAIAAAASPDGKNVYVTARTSDAIAVFSRRRAQVPSRNCPARAAASARAVPADAVSPAGSTMHSGSR